LTISANQTAGKSIRQIKEIQGHMRLRSSGDRHEIRQQYVPLLWSYLIKKLEVEGKDCVPGAIELMDSYFLTKDDWDAILELGVGPMAQESVKLESQTKATFTRLSVSTCIRNNRERACANMLLVQLQFTSPSASFHEST